MIAEKMKGMIVRHYFRENKMTLTSQYPQGHFLKPYIMEITVFRQVEPQYLTKEC